jgi:putative redox protein
MSHKISASWKEALQFSAKTADGIIPLDGPAETGGQGKGHRSKQLMLVALAGCTGMDVALMIRKMKLAVDDFSIDVTGELTDKDPKTYHTVVVIYNFKGPSLDREKLEKAVNLSFDKYCGVIEMFRKFANVNKEIRFTI